MRLLALLLELAAVVGLGAGAVWAYLRLRGRQLGRARWEVATRSLPAGEREVEGVAVELRRAGSAPQRVAFIPSALSYDEFSEALAEAQAEGEAKAAALNAIEPRRKRRR
jgi:hypothetical protein